MGGGEGWAQRPRVSHPPLPCSPNSLSKCQTGSTSTFTKTSVTSYFKVRIQYEEPRLNTHSTCQHGLTRRCFCLAQWIMVRSLSSHQMCYVLWSFIVPFIIVSYLHTSVPKIIHFHWMIIKTEKLTSLPTKLLVESRTIKIPNKVLMFCENYYRN